MTDYYNIYNYYFLDNIFVYQKAHNSITILYVSAFFWKQPNSLGFLDIYIKCSTVLKLIILHEHYQKYEKFSVFNQKTNLSILF